MNGPFYFDGSGFLLDERGDKVMQHSGAGMYEDIHPKYNELTSELMGLHETLSAERTSHAEARAALKEALRGRDDARLIAISSEGHGLGHALAEAWGVDMADPDGPGGVHEKADEAKRRWVLRQGKERAPATEAK